MVNADMHFTPLDPGLRPRSRTSEIARRIETYAEFASKYGQPSHVLYPGCGIDTSPSRVFSSVVYVDNDRHSADILRRKGFDARHADIHSFVSDRDFDLLLVMHFSLSESDFRRLLRSGYVICDSYQSDRLVSNPDFAFVENVNAGRNTGDVNTYGLFRRISRSL